jgi:hypothetical protein
VTAERWCIQLQLNTIAAAQDRCAPMPTQYLVEAGDVLVGAGIDLPGHRGVWEGNTLVTARVLDCRQTVAPIAQKPGAALQVTLLENLRGTPRLDGSGI